MILCVRFEQSLHIRRLILCMGEQALHITSMHAHIEPDRVHPLQGLGPQGAAALSQALPSSHLVKLMLGRNPLGNAGLLVNMHAYCSVTVSEPAKPSPVRCVSLTRAWILPVPTVTARRPFLLHKKSCMPPQWGALIHAHCVITLSYSSLLFFAPMHCRAILLISFSAMTWFTRCPLVIVGPTRLLHLCAGVTLLCSHGWGPSLRTLDLHECQLGPQGVVSKLDLNGNIRWLGCRPNKGRARQ